MRTFKDNAERTWEIDLSIGAIARIKAALKIDLLAPHEPPDFGELSRTGEEADERAKAIKYNGQPAPLVTVLNRYVSLLFDVIFELVRPQAEKQSVSVEDFVNAMGGDAAYEAYKAFHEEWEDFFQKFHRPDAAKMIQKHLELVEAEANKDAMSVDQLAQKAQAEVETRREKLLSQADGVLKTFLSSPESSASTPKS
jgi:hypothetical protein